MYRGKRKIKKNLHVTEKGGRQINPAGIRKIKIIVETEEGEIRQMNSKEEVIGRRQKSKRKMRYLGRQIDKQGKKTYEAQRKKK